MEFFHIILLKNCNVCLERPKINEKEAGSGPCLPKIILCLKYGIKTSHNFTAVVCYGKISFAVLPQLHNDDNERDNEKDAGDELPLLLAHIIKTRKTFSKRRTRLFTTRDVSKNVATQTEELEEKISKFRIDVDTVQGRMLYKSRVTSN